MSIWSTTPVNCVPELRLERWSVREVEPGGTRHLVGYNLTEFEGRVSSAIAAYDARKRLIVTESGRVYELVGPPGHDSDGEYVWGRWLKINGSPTWRGVSDEYELASRESSSKSVRRKTATRSRAERVRVAAALRQLQAQGRYVLRAEELVGLAPRRRSASAIVPELNELAAQGRIVQALRRPARWLVVPSEQAHYGAPPVEWWLDDCLRELEPMYYLGLLSAARYWGSGHYALQSKQVVVSRPRRRLVVGRLRVDFKVKRRIGDTPVVTVDVAGAKLRVSNREATLVDLIQHQVRVGGMEAVARVARDFRAQLHAKALRDALDAVNRPAAAQRLGFIFETLGQSRMARVVETWMQARSVSTVPLSLGIVLRPDAVLLTSRRWRVRYTDDQRRELEELR